VLPNSEAGEHVRKRFPHKLPITVTGGRRPKS